MNNNLIENVRTFFIEQYDHIKSSNSYLSFEPIGCPIDKEDFKAETEEISNTKAVEQLSILGDRLPSIAPFFSPSSTRLSDIYEDLIRSSSFTNKLLNTEDIGAYMAEFGAAKNEALLKLEDGRKASLMTTSGSYMPVYGIPNNWYDPNGAFWIEKSFTQKGEPKEKDTSRQNKKDTSALVVPNSMVWRSDLAIKTKDLKIQPELLIGLMGGVKNLSSQQPKKKPLQENFKTQDAFSFKKSITRKYSQKLFEKKTDKSKGSKPKIVQNLNISEWIKAANFILKEDQTKGAPVKSNQFTMTFDYCIVQLERPWYDTSLYLYSKLWYCLTLPEGYFSTGDKSANNNGALKSIPTAMILIKDLKIKAAWTANDKKKAKESYGLGVFNINNSHFFEDELITPGIQIIGWICEVLPKLPLNGDTEMRT